MKTKAQRSFFRWFAVVLLLLSGLGGNPVPAQPVQPEYEKYFVNYVDKRSYLEKILNADPDIHDVQWLSADEM